MGPGAGMVDNQSMGGQGQDVGQVAKVENLSSQRVKANFSWSNGQNWSKGRLQVGVASFPLK